MHPVDIKTVPDYLDFVKNPIDLSTIEEKVNKGKYLSDKELYDDIDLLFNNCKTYNGESHPIY